jgi:hypothetical protein
VRDALSRRIARLEQRAAAQHAAPCTIGHLECSPEQQQAVLDILLEVGVLRFADDGALLRLADGGEYGPCLGSL